MLSRPLLLLLLAYAGFVSLGLPDAVLGVAWPSLRAAFSLPQAGLGWILAAGTCGYFSSGLLAGWLMQRAGVGSLLFGSTVLVVVGVLGYAFAPSIFVFALAALVVGWGSGAIDSALNAHGARHFRPGQMEWLHAAYSAGAALGAFTMARAVERSGGFRAGYLAVAACLALLTLAFFLTRRLWSASPAPHPDAPERAPDGNEIGVLAAVRMAPVRLGVLSFFVYSGVELGTGHWAYTILVESRGFSPRAAGLAVGVYWGSIFVGRVAAGFVADRVGNVRLVRAGTVLGAAGALAFAVSALPAVAGVVGLVLVGLAIAPIYPGLMSETPGRTGAAAAHAVGFQVSAAIAGAVALPAFGGILAETLGLEATAALVAGCAVALLLSCEALTRLPRLIEVRAGHGAQPE
jgi:fucose permease